MSKPRLNNYMIPDNTDKPKPTPKKRKKASKVEPVKPPTAKEVPTIPVVPLPASNQVDPNDAPLSPEGTTFINKLIQSSIKAYQQTIEDENEQEQKNRQDIEALQHITSEFLNDFIIIGHTLNDRRVVIRNAKTPGDVDKLSELCKRVLIRLMAQEENMG